MRRSYRPLEKEVQQSILDWLGYQSEWFGWRQNAGMSINRYTSKSGHTSTHAFRAAAIDGISDIIGMWDGRFVAIEVKRPGERVKPDSNQALFLENVRRHKGIAIEASDLHTVMEAFNRKETT